ncbi:MAG TPA: DUF3011 domain-containing protein [Bryobacteraceae bacterium]|jgi:hypothetical protein|nr:DUF3011 domain-containing protein [Bryobacteraceae bacterium]
MTSLRKLLRFACLVSCGFLSVSLLPLNAQVISCYSNKGQRTYCRADTSRGIQLVRQRSRAACRLNSSWGFDRRGIWVDRGCAGDFAVARVVNRPGPLRPQIIACSSVAGRRTYCRADVSRGIRLVKQRGGPACVQGRTWGFDNRGIWVDRGCQADFAVGR